MELQTFIDDVGHVVGDSDDQYEITKRVAPLLSALLAGGYRLPPELVRPSPKRHLTYPLYIAPDGSWSLASVVWNVGQRNARARTRDLGCRRNLLGSRARDPLPQAHCCCGRQCCPDTGR